MRAPRLLVVGLLALAAGGCGGDDDESATVQWADDVCSAATEWTESITATAQSLSGGRPEEDELRSTVDELESATREFADDLRGLGRPGTESGEEAKSAMDDLAGDIEEGAAEIKSAIQDVSSGSDVLGAVTAVSAILSTMGEQLSATLARLETLDAQGELEAAFEDADACNELEESRGS